MASQEVEFCTMSDEEEDLVCNQTMDELRAQSGGSFEFQLIPHTDRRARKFGVHRRVFTTRLTQPTEAQLLARDTLND